MTRRLPALTLLFAGGLAAADPQLTALLARARLDFERVRLYEIPKLEESGACVQSQAAALAAAAPAERAVIQLRRGYCALAVAAVTHNRDEFAAAIADFDRAFAAWPVQLAPPGAWRTLPWIARLAEGDADRAAARRELEAALGVSGACAPDVMSGGACERLGQIAREWLGRIALDEGRIEDAARAFTGTAGTGWPEWVEGAAQLRARQYARAAAQYGQAIPLFQIMQATATLGRLLSPAMDLSAARADWGAALLSAGDARGALAALDASLKTSPENPRALYRRARARELLGDREGALADYGMAARTAFAQAGEAGSGEAHVYRGISAYRRGDLTRAESEFASALNLGIAEELRPEARAWRHLAAVSAGSCEASLEALHLALESVAPDFPVKEAREAIAHCAKSR